MNKTYLITLTPTGKFFFGGDMAFKVNGKDTEFTSYIIRSNKFPQQTSLLGMLRFLVLRNDKVAFNLREQKIIDIAKANEIIGKSSFLNWDLEEKRAYGYIESIGPCFLQVRKQSQWTDMQVAPKDALLNVDFGKSCQAVINGVLVEIPEMSYDSKEYYETSYLCGCCGKPTNESEIFKEDVCVGINRDIKTGKTEDNALFKQVSYRFNNKDCQYRFAFYATVDENVPLASYDGQLVSVGGDSSQFVIGIKEVEPMVERHESGTCVVLESPAYLDNKDKKEDLKDVRFAITDIIPFKCMKTKTENVKSYNKRNLVEEYSDGLSLYDKGSVFYFKNKAGAEAFAKKLEGYANFRQIGYNHYRIK